MLTKPAATYGNLTEKYANDSIQKYIHVYVILAFQSSSIYPGHNELIIRSLIHYSEVIHLLKYGWSPYFLIWRHCSPKLINTLPLLLLALLRTLGTMEFCRNQATQNVISTWRPIKLYDCWGPQKRVTFILPWRPASECFYYKCTHMKNSLVQIQRSINYFIKENMHLWRNSLVRKLRLVEYNKQNINKGVY